MVTGKGISVEDIFGLLKKNKQTANNPLAAVELRCAVAFLVTKEKSATLVNPEGTPY